MDERGQDGQLIAALAAGEDAAFDALYDRFARPLYAVGLRWLGDVRDAEELVHDTLIRAWRHADRFDPGRGRVASWLFGIARHIASDQLRARARRPTAAPEAVDDPDVAEQLGWALDVDGLADAWDVAAALERLPAVQREVLLLAYREDLSQSQIADVLGIPVGTVKSRTYHALRATANLLDTAATKGTTWGSPADGGTATPTVEASQTILVRIDDRTQPGSHP